uniref:YfiO domain-containing protein n=1 Tax=Heligmosomoides polygyrus TaxID=6339 RepID=A0A183GGM0_HELPZ
LFALFSSNIISHPVSLPREFSYLYDFSTVFVISSLIGDPSNQFRESSERTGCRYILCMCIQWLSGGYSEAGSILTSFRKKYPGYAAVELRIIGMLRRRAEAERSLTRAPDYSGVISKFEKLIHSSDTPRHLSSYYSVKLARLVRKFLARGYSLAMDVSTNCAQRTFKCSDPNRQ